VLLFLKIVWKKYPPLTCWPEKSKQGYEIKTGFSRRKQPFQAVNMPDFRDF